MENTTPKNVIAKLTIETGGHGRTKYKQGQQVNIILYDN